MDVYSLGQTLRQAREARDLSLQDAFGKTRIPSAILETFEQGVFALPELSVVQTRGMLANYVSFLGLDAEQFLAHLSDAQSGGKRGRRGNPTPSRRPSPTQSRRPDPTETRRPASQTRLQREPLIPQSESRPPSISSRNRRGQRASNTLNLLVIIALTVAALAVIVVILVELLGQPPRPGVDDSVAGIELGQLPPTETFTVAPTITYVITPTLAPRSQQDYQGEPVLVTVDFEQRAWVRVVVDGAELFSGLVRPEELTLEYRAINEMVLTSSNAEALVVTYNGQPQPTYGGRGQEVIVTYRPNNSVTIQTGPGFNPTSEFSETPRVSPTSLAGTLLAEQTPSVTPGPSPTPSNTREPSETPEFSATPPPPPTETATLTPSFTASVTATETETPTATLTSTATAIVPPRVTPVDSTPAKGN
jgi:hypothetical protein